LGLAGWRPAPAVHPTGSPGVDPSAGSQTPTGSTPASTPPQEEIPTLGDSTIDASAETRTDASAYEEGSQTTPAEDQYRRELEGGAALLNQEARASQSESSSPGERRPCSNCGAVLSGGESFCMQCGSPAS